MKGIFKRKVSLQIGNEVGEVRLNGTDGLVDEEMWPELWWRRRCRRFFGFKEIHGFSALGFFDRNYGQHN